jgi:hypothetical protein
MDHSSRLNGDRLEVEVDAGPSVFPLIGPEGGTWEYRLNPQVPTALSVQAGASQLDLDLSKLQITHFKFEGGACIAFGCLNVPKSWSNWRSAQPSLHVLTAAVHMKQGVPDL